MPHIGSTPSLPAPLPPCGGRVRRLTHRLVPVIVPALMVAALGCRDDVGAPTESAPTTPQADVAAGTSATESVTIIGAGDVHAACNNFNQARATAPIVESHPDALVYIIGDNAGVHGTHAEYQCYDQTWGEFKSRTLPAIGNHERNIDPTADGYYDYFNGQGVDSGAAGHRARGYYALTHGGWRIFVANSEQHQADQAAWIARDLAANPARCAMAIWHKPLFTSSSGVKPYPLVRPMWKALYNGGADVILAAHSHQYERFAKMKWDGTRDRTRGIRHFVAGTGGGIKMGFDSLPHPASQVRVRSHGVLKLELWPDRYAWQFIAVTGRVLDSGQDVCH